MVFFSKLLDKLNLLIEYIVCLLLAVMVVTVFLQVIFRFVIHSSLPWSEELARYILVWLSFLGASIGVRRKAHIGVAAITNLLKGVWRRGVSILVPLFATVFFLFLTIYGYRILKVVFYQLSPAMEISMAIPYSAVCVSSVLMVLYSVDDFVKVLAAIGGGGGR